MTVELYIIAISASILFLLVSIRFFRIAYAANEKSPRFLRRSDFLFKALGIYLYDLLIHVGEKINNFFKSIPQHVLHLIHDFLNFLSRKTKKWVDLVKGKNIQTNKGAVSLYLKKLDEDKR